MNDHIELDEKSTLYSKDKIRVPYPPFSYTELFENLSSNPNQQDLNTAQDTSPIPTSPFIENLRTMKIRATDIGVEAARAASITEGNLHITSEFGLTTSLENWLDDKERSWEFDPFPQLNTQIANSIEYDSCSYNNEKRTKPRKLYEYLQHEVCDMNKNNGGEIDIELLTPSQALEVVMRVLSRRVIYDHLAASNVVDVANIPSHQLNQDEREILRLKDKDPKKFIKEVNRINRKLDESTADRILKNKKGVCRHFAATASVLYDALKDIQKGTLLNGSYLAFYNEKFGKDEKHQLIGLHAYNIFVVTRPNEKGEPDIFTSVIDFTHGNRDDGYDFTYKRLSQGIYFLREMGNKLGIRNIKCKTIKLAEEARDRLLFNMMKKDENDSLVYFEFLEMFRDYATLTTLSEPGENGKNIETLSELLKKRNYQKTETILLLMGMEPFSDENFLKNGEPGIRSILLDYLAEFNTHIKEAINENHYLLDSLAQNMGECIKVYAKTIKNKDLFKRSGFATKNGIFDFTLLFFQASIKSGYLPTKEQQEAANYIMKTASSAMDKEKKELCIRFNKLTSNNPEL